MSTLAPPNRTLSTNTFFQKLLWGAVVVVLLVIGFCIFSYGLDGATVDSVAHRDFISYWAAGRQLIHGENPYDANILATERSFGWQRVGPMIMRNPPSALFLILPLGFVRPKTAYQLWSLFIFAAWLGSIHMIWIMNGRRNNSLHLIGYFFAPAIACFAMGQMAAFVLLGLTLFLYFHRTRPLLAGAALVLCALKPHLLLEFGTVLLMWAITRRAYRLIAGAIVALTICCAVPLIFDPSIYTQYAAMAHTMGIKTEFIPTLSQLFRIAVNPNAFWLQFLPSFCGCLWAIWYFHRHRTDWDWRAHGPLLVLVSVVAAPYAWFFDGIILLPSLLYAAYRARPGALAVLFVLLALAGAQMLLGTLAHSAWYLWPSAAWLVWFLWSMRHSSRLTASSPEV